MKRVTNTQALRNALCQPVIQQQQLDSLFQIKPSPRTIKSSFAKTAIVITVAVAAGAFLWAKSTVMVPV